MIPDPAEQKEAPGLRRPAARGGLPLALRSVAVLLVVLALLDPALPSKRNLDLVLSVVAVDGEERTEVARSRVANRLEDRARVVSGGYPGADATVLVGDHLPLEVLDDTWTLPEPVFMVRPGARSEWPGDGARILALHLPGRADPGSRIPVRATVQAPRGEGGDRAAILTGGQLLTDTPLPVQGSGGGDAGDGLEALEVRLDVVPPGSGPLPLRFQVGDAGADVLVQVEPRRWNVHIHDLRPSWKSTFVRRALEPDPRFRITSRTATAPGTATAFGPAPASLTAPGALDGLDLVAVGAPEGLSAAEVATLEAWVREEGGTLVLLGDVELSGPVSGLTGVTAWARLGRGESWALVDPDRSGAAPDTPGEAPPRLRARTLLRPDRLPAGAQVLAATSSGDPAVWSRALGQGTVLVSGALDSWHFRDPETSAFESSWREWVAWGASLKPLPLEVEWVHASRSGGARVGMAGGVGAGVVAPGALARFQVTLGPEVRGGVQGGVQGESAAHARARLGDRVLPLAPGHHPGSFQGWLHAPEEPGAYEIVVEAAPGGVSAQPLVETVLPLVVLADAAPAPPDPTELLETWVAARGGTLHAEDEFASLVAGIASAVEAEGPAEPWHPMRSPWWILPLALALAGEWWWRRRRGLA